MIRYKQGYKYKLVDDYTIQTSIVPGVYTGNEWVKLLPNGKLTIKDGYAWDGASGPAIDTNTFMRSSLVHDALYQLMSENLLDIQYKDAADLELKRISLEDGMSSIRAWYVYAAVRLFGKSAIRNGREIKTAP